MARIKKATDATLVANKEDAKVEKTDIVADKKASKKTVKVDTTKKDKAKATLSDFKVLIGPYITEKTMQQLQNTNTVTFKVIPSANKTNIKLAFERVYKVDVKDVKIINVSSKSTTRGGRYQGKISGFKKALITLKEGQAIDLYKE